jgi:DNA-binding response OmpR family regulator
VPLAVSAPVLVVEDDPLLRDLYRSSLRQAGYAVIDVEDGVAALRALEARRPAAVVLDLALPRLSGRDVHREMKSHPDMKGIPVIVVSGSDISDLNAADFSSILTKPLKLDNLTAAVDDGIRRARRMFHSGN